MSAHRFDVLIITALLDELEAVLASGEGGRERWSVESITGFPVHFGEVAREGGGEPLRVAAASLEEMGETATAGRTAVLIDRLNPACVAMCVICAGNKKDVSLGDVIMADRVYNYEAGKFLARTDAHGNRTEEFLPDLKTFNLKAQMRVSAKYFSREPAWMATFVKGRPPSREAQERWLLRALLEHEEAGAVAPDEHPDRDTCCPTLDRLWDRLRLPKHGLLVETPGELKLTEKGRGIAKELKRKYRKELPKDREFKVHVGPIATGPSVQQDPELFERLSKLGRKTLGAEMEAVAIGWVGDHFERPAIVVKAVSDYGDGDKDDSFREFATRASAEVLLRFLARHLEPSVQQEKKEGSEPGSERHPGGASHGDDLLSRVKAITELRMRGPDQIAEIRRCRTRPPLGQYLEVEKIQGTFHTKAPIAAVRRVTEEVLEAFLTDIASRYRREDSGVVSTIVYEGEPPEPAVASRAAERRVRLQSLTEYRGLIDFTEYLQRQGSQLEKDAIYPPALYVAQRALLPEDSGQARETDDALAELTRWLTSPEGRFVLVLGDFGTGKTFLLHELARRMGANQELPIPVLIEMRRLEKASQLDALIAQHLSLAGMGRIDLPAFRYMLADGRIALLFDGFDELAARVTYKRATEHFATLMEAAKGEAKVVITSRTQHFLSDRQVKLALAQQASLVKGARLLRLQRFENEQIQRFLVKWLRDEGAARRRFQLLDEVRDLLGLAHNPRMLGFIVDIPEEKLLEAKARHGEITAARLYEMLLERWLKGEVQRAQPPGAPTALDEQQRWKAVTELALRLWQRTERTIHSTEVPQELEVAFSVLATRELEPEVAGHQIGSGTLLVRDEEGNFSFIHQSVMEWLVAKVVAQQIQQGERVQALEGRELTPLMADFVWGWRGARRRSGGPRRHWRARRRTSSARTRSNCWIGWGSSRVRGSIWPGKI